MTRPAARPTAPAAGFTLLELLIALAIVAALVAVAFGGLRVGLAAWRQGEERAEAHQHVRSVALTLARTLGGAYPYRASRGLSPEPVVLFDGKESHVEFVTRTPPAPPASPIAFVAVVVTLETGERSGLVIRQRALPNRDPFDEAEVVLHDPSITRLELGYLDQAGAWQTSWEGGGTEATPRAVRITVGLDAGGRTVSLPPVTVPIRTPPS